MLTVRLDHVTEKQLNFLAQEQHLTKSTIVKEALVHYFDMLKNKAPQKTPYELGSEFFGKYESGRGDLSSTYKQKLKEKIDVKNSRR